MRITKGSVIGGIIFGLLSLSKFCAADNTANITVNVMVTADVCEINNGQNIDVDFGDSIVTTDVMAGTVQKTIAYTFDCSNADTSKTLKMRITGSEADFTGGLLKTTISDLAIKLKADGVDYPINSDLSLASKDYKPNLVAVLVGKPGARLPTGGFTAGATMMVDYQ